jgi:hypothetical protein
MNFPGILAFTLLTLTTALVSCKTPQTTADDRPVKSDKRLAGRWMGCEKGYQIEGVTRCWIMEREKDGTFSIYFEVDNKEAPGSSTEYGKWWTKDGIFYEYHNNSGRTDTYLYEFTGKDQIKFISTGTSPRNDSSIYEFYDHKLTGKQPAAPVLLDGSSPEKAIKVKSIAEEYEYISKHCVGCRVVMQSLINKKGRYYDAIEVLKADGEKFTYYFDITSFFGKRFK